MASEDVDHFRHRDRRVNIPSAELDDFVGDDDRAPTEVFYERYAPRDVDDPVLVWQEKQAEDRRGLTVTARPIFIQEKIHPRVLIDDLRTHSAELRGDAQQDELPSLFADFNGIEFEQLVDFYEHEQNWSNRLILGDALTVMTSLAEKERLRGKVQMIYVDPPYGIKFGSNWQVSTDSRNVRDGKETDLTRQPEQIKAFRDTWRLGVSSYLSYLRDRLTVARGLLTESGSIFVQIGDENIHLVRSLLDEVFGGENFVSLITITKSGTATTDVLGAVNEYLLWYGKDRRVLKHRRMTNPKKLGGSGASKYDQVEEPDGSRRPMTTAERRRGSIETDGGRAYRHDNLTSQSVGREKGEGAASWFDVQLEGNSFNPGRNRWKTNEEGMTRLLAASRVAVTGNSLSYVRFLDDFPAVSLTNQWDDIGGIQSRADPKIYVVQTPKKVIERCLLMTTDPGDLVLDPTCGSGATAVVAEEWARRWITIDTSRVALALARTRLMGARYPYYLLADSAQGAAEARKRHGRASAEAPFTEDVKQGFVYRRVPHITLKSIAQNPDIREGMTRDEIDAAIVRHGESETLYDQPYEDRKKVRVTGPFTVESLSSHRSMDDGRRTGTEQAAAVDPEQPDFTQLVLEHLRTSGVQNTIREERLELDELVPVAGEWLVARGRYTTADGEQIRVAVSLGPETGTVGQRQVREAAKEAMEGFGADLLLVCGFAFDAAAGQRAKQIEEASAGRAEHLLDIAAESNVGALRVLLAKINPDLQLGDRLENTGQGNIFLVFGEPDVSWDRDGDEMRVTINGVDVYDPTTGQVRSQDTDSVAAWFVDTAYNGESFFVRHAYFAGDGDGGAAAVDSYNRLKRALRAEIDDEAWATLYRTTSRPFEVPESGRVAVKVINDYGDEVMRVLDVAS